MKAADRKELEKLRVKLREWASVIDRWLKEEQTPVARTRTTNARRTGGQGKGGGK